MQNYEDLRSKYKTVTRSTRKYFKWNDLMEYFTPWKNIPGKASQIRPKWVRDALNTFVDIKIAERIDENRYRIQVERRFREDLKEVFIRKFCSLERHREGLTLERWAAQKNESESSEWLC